ncbi:Ureidoglycolate lyase [Burkholderia pseudomultivorans]|uniref:Ureidoglycolate lyase n=1 Tax=Burkholderia pseudomultivorans TaxID=1207504 RepID=A0ABU2EDE7_9BURK|nr:Ureidoglycolate lyase [Burkholderia pseudomultivorans]MDR8739065.1 Ureidoglycolate lyase [Burkholderia pseudomultivorans]MDR8745623.1 Ureidoglycolate lyase [Burkholderia pseudomultivorans]MDR8757917.1 Ureidoglycolate lyase [Burkholderia pseudomultivorans]MDR8781968.1 Ureidoglycolate lyase [Burkholderia pseudomultivorans]
MSIRQLSLEPLTKDRFAPFGDVIEIAGHSGFQINDGMATRYHDLARIDVSQEQGRPIVSIVTARPNTPPYLVNCLQRYPLSSQAFVPLTGHPFIVVVAEAEADTAAAPKRLSAFVTDGKQGVNYRPGIWHHTLIVPNNDAVFLAIDRGGPGKNCDQHWFAQEDRVLLVQADASDGTS